jgi:hypothetical protein
MDDKWLAAIRRRSLQLKLRLRKQPKLRDGSTQVFFPLLSGEESPEFVRAHADLLEEHKKRFAQWLMQVVVAQGGANGGGDLVFRAAFDTASDAILAPLGNLSVIVMRYEGAWFAYTGTLQEAREGLRPIELSMDTLLRLESGGKVAVGKRAITQFDAVEALPVLGPIPAEAALLRKKWDAKAWGSI